MRTTFSFSKYANNEQFADIVKKLLDRVQSEPGVVSAAVSSGYPLQSEVISAGSSGVLRAVLAFKADGTSAREKLRQWEDSSRSLQTIFKRLGFL